MKKAFLIMASSAMAAGCADNSIPTAQLPELDLSKNGTSLNLSTDYLANEQTSFEDNITTYKADIQNTKAVLDIENARNAKITIKVDSEAKKLISTQIEYVGAGGSSVIVTVTPYYN